ncbi:MAG TPA: DUF434 domain-containing protein [Methanobacteriaceae archaeon]|nr:DUF434 domain-containing protein [Methanobacteriaceae archaeon]
MKPTFNNLFNLGEIIFINHEKLKIASKDLRYLLNQGYRKKIALNFVANHYLLNKKSRNYLARSVFSNSLSQSRRSKIVNFKDINGKILFLDGYNVLITVESILNNYEVILADDGLLRDVQGIFGKYKFSSNTNNALTLIFECVSKYPPREIKFYLDQQVSFSGKLGQEINEMLKNYDLNGTSILSNNVDYHITQECANSISIAATSDGIIVDKVEKVVDIPHFILKKGVLN